MTDDGFGTIADSPRSSSSARHHGGPRWKQTITGCAQQGESPGGVTVRCTFDLHMLGSDQLGLGPFGDNYWDLTIRDGKIISGWMWAPSDINGFAERSGIPSPSGSPPSILRTST